MIVEHQDVDLQPLHDAGDDLRVEHHVAAVAHQGKHLAVRGRHLGAEGGGDLVPHAGKAVFHVVRVRRPGPPDPLEIAGQAARSPDDDRVLGEECFVQLSEAPRLGQPRGIVRGVEPIHLRRPPLPGVPDLPGVGGAIGHLRQHPGQGREGRFRIGDHGKGAHLMGVEAVDVDRQELHLRVLKKPFGGRREIAEPRPDADDEIGVAGDGVRRQRARHPDPAQVEGVVPGQHPLPGLRLAERDIALRAEPLQRPLGARIADAAAADHQRLPLGGDERRRPPDLVGVGGAAHQMVNPPAQEVRRVVVRLRLDVLRERQGDRSGLGRIGEHAHGVQTGAHQLLRPRDPIPVPTDRFECVVGRDVGVGELLHLLEHRVGLSAGEGVSGEEQHRDAIHRGGSRRRDHVERPRPDRAGHGTDLSAPHLLGVGDGRMRHALLVVPLVIGQSMRAVHERLAEPHHVPVAEDPEHPSHELGFRPVDIQVLVVEKTHQRLRHGQPYRLHFASTSVACQDETNGRGATHTPRPEHCISKRGARYFVWRFSIGS